MYLIFLLVANFYADAKISGTNKFINENTIQNLDYGFYNCVRDFIMIYQDFFGDFAFYDFFDYGIGTLSILY